MSTSDEDPDLLLVEKAMDTLAEHFDTVEIFVTSHNSNGTMSHCRGAGNYHARFGQIREWIVKEEEAFRKSVRPQDE